MNIRPWSTSDWFRVIQKIGPIILLFLNAHWQKSWENIEKNKEKFPQFSQNENNFVEIGV